VVRGVLMQCLLVREPRRPQVEHDLLDVDIDLVAVTGDVQIPTRAGSSEVRCWCCSSGPAGAARLGAAERSGSPTVADLA
jgi:hypothetical protein